MRWRRTVIAGETIPNDGCLEVDGRVVARVYIIKHGPAAGEWNWFWQQMPGATGRAPTKGAAKAECEQRAREAFGLTDHHSAEGEDDGEG